MTDLPALDGDAAPPPLGDILRVQARRRRDREAMCFEGRKSSYTTARMVIAREFVAGRLFDYIERDGITRLFIVPPAMHMLLDGSRMVQGLIDDVPTVAELIDRVMDGAKTIIRRRLPPLLPPEPVATTKEHA